MSTVTQFRPKKPSGRSFVSLLWIALFANIVFARPDVTALLDEARSQEKAGAYAVAEQIYQRALSAEPGNLEVSKRLGVLQQTELKFGDSIQTFQRILSADPVYPQVNFFLGVSYYGLNDLPKAIASLEQELKTVAPHPRTRSYLATLLESSGRNDEAIQQLNHLLADNPENADALYQLARLHKNASFQAMERLKQLDPDSFQVHLLLGELYSDEQRYPESIKEYQLAQQKQPHAQGIHYAIAVAYWSQHLYEPAEKEFLEAYRENPRDGLTNLYIGDIAVRDGKFGDALPYLETAREVLPTMPQVHVLLGKCYQAENELQKAKAEFQLAIQSDPSASQPHYLLAQVYRRLNDSTGSTAELAKFEELSKTEKATPTTGMGSTK